MRVLIVDDEDAARTKIARFLSDHEDCELIGEAGDGDVAVRMILAKAPDLVFLDIHMPGMDGFQTLEQLPETHRPHVVFATAFSDRAVQAFEVHAVDYLLKPFDRRRFDQALERVRGRIGADDPADERIFTALQALAGERRFAKQLLVQDTSTIKVVPTDEVDYVASADNYVVLHCGGKEHLMRATMAQLEAKLDPSQFCRVHRQTIVRLSAIQELEPWTKGDMIIRLHSGAKLKLSRRFRDQLMERMS